MNVSSHFTKQIMSSSGFAEGWRTFPDILKERIEKPFLADTLSFHFDRISDIKFDCITLICST